MERKAILITKVVQATDQLTQTIDELEADLDPQAKRRGTYAAKEIFEAIMTCNNRLWEFWNGISRR